MAAGKLAINRQSKMQSSSLLTISESVDHGWKE